jgi:hypothetical protein
MSALVLCCTVHTRGASRVAFSIRSRHWKPPSGSSALNPPSCKAQSQAKMRTRGDVYAAAADAQMDRTSRRSIRIHCPLSRHACYLSTYSRLVASLPLSLFVHSISFYRPERPPSLVKVRTAGNIPPCLYCSVGLTLPHYFLTCPA